ncbi:uncharacterized protein LOC112533946 [Ricinus communis]|uniref:Uncharacterized protein n=1 Tax=Ricinus communis TaxID=3988 RepID=B9RJJ7_RICCO|nr:uncharacterized protein LOC112533946 [Ricinus communis]EEF48499.1 conserved hypothetical protein [Ricinus communis]|eukprot:XP_025012207.1 uncharacterized protein LOC112533946 [Ricinus communis]
MEMTDEAARSEITRRCAKAAFLLHSLKSSPNRHSKTSINGEDEEMDLMVKQIGDLKMKLARERTKNKRIKLCGLMEVILQVMMLLCFSTLLLVLAFNSPSN